MTPRFDGVFRAFDLGLLHAAAWLVPAGRRAEWQEEWRAELWHVRRSRTIERGHLWQTEHEIAGFCVGAFRDAFCLRHQRPSEESRTESRAESRPPRFRGSAAQCILVLGAVLAACFSVARLNPGVRVATESARWQMNSGLILIGNARDDDKLAATVPAMQYRSWKASRQQYFDQLAFYRVAHERVATAGGGSSRWTVAHASENLFSLLGLPIRWGAPDARQDELTDSSAVRAIVSCEAIENGLAAGGALAAGSIRVSGRVARIAGIAPCGAWKLPGKVDAWLLEPDTQIGAGAQGFAVAHLTAAGREEMQGMSVQIAAGNASDDSSSLLRGDAIDNHQRGPWDIYLFTVMLAFLALPAVTSVSMGESSYTTHKPPRSRLLWRWSFLAAKIALLLPIAYYASMDLAYWHVMAYPSAPEYVQLIATFLICLFGMRWVLLDQRHRCPVCLRLVSNPAQVGYASRTFLAWNGTEMICTGGHTLLHIPALPTSWFGAQRWTYLDGSWEFLFARTSAG